MTYQAIALEAKDAVATVTLNRPDVLNAMNSPMRQELHDAFTRLQADRDVKVILVTGARTVTRNGGFVPLSATPR